MAYYVKLTADGASWGWCYVGAIQKTPAVVTMVGSHVPLPGGPPLPLFGGNYPWDVTGGWMHAYPVLHELPWLNAEPAPLRFPSWVPAAVTAMGFHDVAAFVLRGSPLRKIFSDPSVRRMVAEDLVLERATPFLRGPSFVPVDDQELTRWQTLRPDAHRFAAEEADQIVREGNLTGVASQHRRRLRLEAHRKIDRVREDFSHTPCIASEPFLEILTSAGPMKVGRSRSTGYPEGVGAVPVSDRAKNPAIISSTEAALLPGHLDLAERLSYLPWQEKFAAWEERSPHPAFACSQWTDDLPAGLLVREGIAELLAGLKARDRVDITASELSPFGIYPLISPPALEFVQQAKIDVPSAEECARVCLSRAWRV